MDGFIRGWTDGCSFELAGVFTGRKDIAQRSAGDGEGVELRLHPPQELHGLLQRPRQLLPVLHQHLMVRLLREHQQKNEQVTACEYLLHNLGKMFQDRSIDLLTMNWSSSGSVAVPRPPSAVRCRSSKSCATAVSLADTSGGAPTYNHHQG